MNAYSNYPYRCSRTGAALLFTCNTCTTGAVEFSALIRGDPAVQNFDAGKALEHFGLIFLRVSRHV